MLSDKGKRQDVYQCLNSSVDCFHAEHSWKVGAVAASSRLLETLSVTFANYISMIPIII